MVEKTQETEKVIDKTNEKNFILFKKIIERDEKNGKNPWLHFIPVDYDFIKEHFGSEAVKYARLKRNEEVKNLKERIEKIVVANLIRGKPTIKRNRF